MTFDSMAHRMAGSLNRVFGTGDCTYRQTGEDAITGLYVTFRQNVELLDDNEQVVDRVTTARLATSTFTLTPKRGDRINDGQRVYTVGRQLENDGYSILLEVTT